MTTEGTKKNLKHKLKFSQRVIFFFWNCHILQFEDLYNFGIYISQQGKTHLSLGHSLATYHQ